MRLVTAIASAPNGPIGPESVATLAQTQGGKSIGPPLIMIGVLLAVVIVGGAIVWIIRTRFFSDRSASDRSLFEELRRMRDEGQLSDEEYQAVRGSAVRRERERMAREEEKAPGPDGGPDRNRTRENGGHSGGPDAGGGGRSGASP
jgi:hypothetical protein